MAGRSGIVAGAALGGLAAAVLDIGVAALINRVGTDVVLRAIARGVLGRAAMSGGASAAALGFGLQLAMGALIGAIYGLAAARVRPLIDRWLLCGVVYGVVIFLVMEFVVVPLSAVGKVTHFTLTTLTLNMSAMLLFGTAVAFAAWRGSRT